MRRGQAAIEYLIILAVVVIIALIVIGVIGGFPGMTRGVSERDSASYWSGADVGVTRYYVAHTSANSMLVIRNNRLFSVNVTAIALGSAGTYSNAWTGVLPLAPGSSSNITLNGTIPTCTAGNSYSMSMAITYVDSVYGQTYNFSGEKPLVGTCQP